MGASPPPDKQLTPLELRIMTVLWKLGPSNVQTVQENLLSGPKLAYTTVQTMLNVLHRKGRVKRVLRGRAYEYEPVLSRDGAVRHALRDMIDRLFGGSVDGLLMSLVDTKQLDLQTLARLKDLIERHEGGTKRVRRDG
jgi:BlaI family transcriptional regulator, penicillinase repressor